jgi:hypothetical protein
VYNDGCLLYFHYRRPVKGGKVENPVIRVIELLLERLYDLEDCDPCLYLLQKEQLEELVAMYEADHGLTLERVAEVLEREEV